MHQYLRRLTEISAIALLGVVCGVVQGQTPSNPPAPAAQAAPAQKEKKVKDQGEYDLYTGVTKETDPNKKLALLTTWKEKYPDSDFKQERLQFFLVTYQQLGQAAKVIDTAKQMLAADPKDVQALYAITLSTPSVSPTADTLDTGEKAANGLLAAQRPEATKEDDWKIAQANAYRTLGWIAMQRKNNEVAEQNFVKSLQINPNAGDVAYWMGTVVLAEKKPEKQSLALYEFARAASYDGPGGLNPQGRQQIDTYLTKAYTTYHGDTTGLAELKTQAKASPLPPADFKIKSAMEVAAEKEEELKKTNPELALWLNIKGQLLAPEGQQYFDSSMKGAAVPKLKGWLVSAKPAVRSKELLLSMEGKDQPANVTLKLVNAEGTAIALAGKPEVGVEIEFEGVGDAFTKEPFMVTFNVEKAKITGLKEEKVAPAAKKGTVHKKKS